MARIIYADPLFSLNAILKHRDIWLRSSARDHLRQLALREETDLCVANVAARLVKRSVLSATEHPVQHW